MSTTHAAPRRDREVRTFTAPAPIEVRTLADGTKQVSGYAIVFNSESVDLGGFTEICDPKMLDRTLTDSPDVLCLRDHRQELLLGRTTANTLKLAVDSKGLAFKLNLPNSPTGEDAAEAIRRKDLTSCSFGFAMVQDSWREGPNGQYIRTLLDIDLFEISITSFPAYEATSVVSTRSAPKELRSKLAQSKRDLTGVDEDGEPCDPDMDDDCEEQDSANPCQCRCERCAMRDCANCYHRDCRDTQCAACPMQDDVRSDALRIRALFAHRMK